MSVSEIVPHDPLCQAWYQSSATTPSVQDSGNPQEAQGAGQFSQILQSLGTDLQSGNLENAQQDFAQLQQTLQGINQAQGHHRHHHGHGRADAGQPTRADGSPEATTATATSVLSTAVGGISPSQPVTTTAS